MLKYPSSWKYYWVNEEVGRGRGPVREWIFEQEEGEWVQSRKVPEEGEGETDKCQNEGEEEEVSNINDSTISYFW